MSDTTAKSILIGNIPLKSGDEFRVEITNFNGGHWVNIRRWFLNDAGELNPTKLGVNVAIEHLPKLSILVRDARKRARADGLLPKKKRTNHGQR